MKKKRHNLILLTAGVFLIISSVLFEHFNTFTLTRISEIATANFERKAQKCEAALGQLLEKNPAKAWQDFAGLYTSEKIGVYLFKSDSLVFWNNSQFPVSQNIKDLPNARGFVKLDHGSYIYLKNIQKEKTAIALCLVKAEYDLQNNYLKNNFSEWTGIPRDIKMDTANINETAVIYNGEKIFSLNGGETRYGNTIADTTSFIIFILGFVIILIACLSEIKNNVPAKIKTAFYVAGILLLRSLMIWLKWPAFLYRTELYDLQLFGNAQSYANGYLGDILFNAVTFVFLAGVVHFRVLHAPKRNSWLVNYLIVFGLIFVVVNQFNQTAISLITNSTLNFDFLSIFNFKFPAFIGLMALSFYSLALFVLVNKSIALLDGNKSRDFMIFLAFNAAVCLLQQVISQTDNYFESLWLLPFAIIMYSLIRVNSSKVSLNLGLQIIIMSVVTSKFFNVQIEKNQEKDLEILSIKLSERQDAILESEFAGIPEKIVNDENFNRVLSFISEIPNAEKELEQFLRQKYFSGYFDRYNINFSLFDKKNCDPLLPVNQNSPFDQGYFENQIRYNSDSTFVKGLFFVKNHRVNSQYIGEIKLKDKNLYVLMEPKQFEELGSFPDLLLDQSQQKQERLKNLSHAVYRSQQITSRYGEFNYPFFLPDSTSLSKSNPDFIHHHFEPEETTTVIISKNAKRWNYFFTFNSYLLLFFSLMTYAAYLVYSAFFTTHFTSPSLTRRIQTIIIILLLLAMSAVGITSGRLVTKQFERDNKKQLEEKTQIIINELTEQFKVEQFFESSQKELMNLKLKEYSRLFNTPISLFSKEGFLFNTSEPKLYDLGLAASVANPRAYWNLMQNRSSSESVNEKAGTLKYTSLYTPLFGTKKELIGFLNLPYFARSSDLVNELSGIISALINVYVILFVISILAGLILSGLITQPLRIIKQQLGNVTLGRQNEKIVWQSDDEIGRLVSEYNQMLVKLENSANLLAQNERESAWREMAKQVAHEIKNPLTPMKLNLQYLQHLMKNNPEDFREKFERASAGIIEQIDSLANIANEFSSFAKLPGTRLETINLAEVITASVLIFENQKDLTIKNTLQEKEILVKGDRDQCLRVFNNILKNAVQAVDEVENALIEIRYHRSGSVAIISISDNGCGINDELKTKIFTPNFTTKTTGSGLGLAMVKNIIQGFGGDIRFESEAGKGSVFYLEFIAAN
jgi:two-component system nitrogen regulation sensor histidine kinase NtrY